MSGTSFDMYRIAGKQGIRVSNTGAQTEIESEAVLGAGYVERTEDFVIGPNAPMTPFLVLPFVAEEGQTTFLVEYSASVLMVNANTNEQGSVHSIFLDGVLVLRASAYETLFDPDAPIEEQRSVSIQKQLTGIAPGLHMVELRMSTSADVIAGGFYAGDPASFSASLHIFPEVLP